MPSSATSPPPEFEKDLSPANVSAALSEICGYPIDSALRSSQADEPDFLGSSYLAIGPSGRGIVLKPLDRDCLLKSGLHPSIKERLSRVRELALSGVCNLYGVERDTSLADPQAAWLIWEYAQGKSLDQLAIEPACTPRKLALAARELVLMVESLHRQGIVHGAIRASNIIIDAYGAVRLTHVSPLLYTDPGDDLWGVLHTLRELVQQRKEDKTPLGRLLEEVSGMLDLENVPAPAPEAILRLLATRLAGIIEVRERTDRAIAVKEPPDTGPRRRSLLSAFLVLLLGAAIAYGIYYALDQAAVPMPKTIQLMKDAWEQ